MCKALYLRFHLFQFQRNRCYCCCCYCCSLATFFFNIQNSNKNKNAMASVTYVAQTRLSVLLSVIYASRASQVLFNVLSLHTLLIIWPDLSMCVFIKCAHRLLFTYYAFGVTETTIFYLLDFIFIFSSFFFH